jgi:Uma2 family endonuclease
MMSATLLNPPAASSDETLYEVVNGQLVEKPVGAYSNWLAEQLQNILRAYVNKHRLGYVAMEMVFILDALRDLRRRPDVAFVSAERWPVGQPPPVEGDWDVIPDLAVEVVSPREETRRSLRKINEYFRYGVKEVWLASPEERLVHCYTGRKTIRVLDADEELATSLIPGWKIRVGDWLPEIPAAESDSPREPRTK